MALRINPAHFPIPRAGFLPVNAFVIRAKERVPCPLYLLSLQGCLFLFQVGAPIILFLGKDTFNPAIRY
jgi:hypothetical protein